MNQNDNNDQSTQASTGAFSKTSADKLTDKVTGPATKALPDKQADAFYITGGNVPADALSYVTRDADARLLQHLLHGDFCYILTSRQMGKSSLMTHMVKRLREHQVAPAVLDLSSQGFSLSAEQWYNGLLEQLGRRLKIEDEIDDFCQDHPHLSPLQLWQQALRDVVLQTLTTPIVIFIDEIDVVRSLTFSTDEFFAAIRACYNARTEDPAFARLSFCLLGVATPADLIANPKLTPFNIGTRIELSDFSREEANGLSHGLGPNAETNRVLLDRIYYWTGGHPYLTQRLCQAVAENDANLTERSVDACAEKLFLSSKAQRQDSNLMFVQQRMLPTHEEQRVGLLTLYARVLSGKGVVADSETGAFVSELKLAGIVAAVDGQLRVRNRIYAQVFGKSWIEENIPGAEMRRQQTAYRKGMFRVGTVASAIVGVMGLLTLWAVQAQQQANNFRIKAETQAALAQQQRQAAERTAYIANMNLIPISYAKNDFKTIARLLEEIRTNGFRGFEWGYWNRLAHLDIFTLKDAGIAAFSPDGKRIVTAEYGGKTIKIRDAATGAELLTFKGQFGVGKAVFFPDGKRIITSYVDYKSAKIWDAITGREVLTWKGHTDEVLFGEITPDGTGVVTMAKDKTIRIRNVATGYELVTFKGRMSNIGLVAFSPDGKQIVIENGDKTLKTWDVGTGRELLSFDITKVKVNSATFSPNGKVILTRNWGFDARVWDARTGKEILTLRGHNDGVGIVAFSPDGKRILTCGSGETKMWNAEGSSEALATEEQNEDIGSLSFSPDGGRMVSSMGDRGNKAARGDNTVKVWDCSTGRDLHIPLGYNAWVTSATFSPDGKRIATGSPKGYINIWDSTTGHEELALKGHTNRVVSMAFSPDGRHLFTGSWDKAAKVWDAVTGRKEFTLREHSQRQQDSREQMLSTGGVTLRSDVITSAAFSPDGKRLVTASSNKNASVWDLATGREVVTINGHPSEISAVAFSPDGKRLVSGDWAGTVKIWNARSGRELLTLWGYDRVVTSVAFSPDNTRVVTGGWDGAVRVWDAATGRETLELAPPKSFTRTVSAVMFSPDGRRIAATTGNHITVWFSDANDWKEAMRDTNAANAQTLQDTEQANSHLSLAVTLVNAHNYTQAVTEYKAVLRLRPALGDAAFLGSLGWYEYLAGQIDDAIKSSRSALEKDASLTYVRLNLGLCYATQNDWPRAKQEYDLAVKAAQKASLKAGIEDVQAAIKKQANPALSQALVYLQKAEGK